MKNNLGTEMKTKQHGIQHKLDLIKTKVYTYSKSCKEQ